MISFLFPENIINNSIKIDDIQVGSTDYLDVVPQSYFNNCKDYNICTGIDKYNRPFLSMLITIEKKIDNEFVFEKECIYTIFQRYTDDNKYVICPSHYKTDKILLSLMDIYTLHINKNNSKYLNDFISHSLNKIKWERTIEEYDYNTNKFVNNTYRCWFYID